MISRIAFVLTLLFLISGCAHNSSSKNYASHAVGVDPFSADSEAKSPQISEGVDPTKYGPGSEGQSESKTEEEREPIVGLFIDPGVYKSFGVLQLVEALKRRGVEPVVFSGVGLGGVVALNLALGKESSEIEWEFYKFIRGVKNAKTYSKKWTNSLIKTFFGKGVQYKSIANAKRTIVLPIYDRKKNVPKFLLSGKISDLVSLSFNFENRSERFSSSLINKPISPEFLYNYGVDIIVWVVPHQGEIKLANMDGYHFGVLSRYLGRSLENDENEKLVKVSFPSSKVPLDSTSEIASFIQEVHAMTPEFVNSVREKISDWKEKNRKPL